MKLEISLSSGPQWVIPEEEDLALEFRYEYALPQRNWAQRCKTIGARYPLFENESDFVTKVNHGRIQLLTRSDQVHNRTQLRSIEEIEDLVSGYAYPRDVARIVEGFKKGVIMPMPIIIKGTKGMWILSGNTRQNIASVMKLPTQVIIVDAS